MKVDLYTKTVLTVIAACLTVLVLKEVEVLPKAHADSSVSYTKGNVNYGLVPVNADGTINVKLSTTDVVKVAVEEVDRYAFRYCTVPVEVQ
ncbi:hypothetical protein ACFS7Z_08495 [Pontibacter toksunensis]|uniref:Uncharacterized protein n=1 Tax=Pontibacter toksunensis TaxID=1332631 RepID=A0ABW6BVF6_9BACT